jgi:hypothetical protein
MIKPMHSQEAPTDEPIPNRPPADPAMLAADLGHGLQLSRASTLALTRLQLAIKSSDRQAAMAALDRLHALDAEMERLVDHLPAPAAEDPAWAERDALARHLGDQKLALAFEKLALASEISGPDLVSPRPPQPFPPPARPGEWAASQTPSGNDDPPPLADWPRRGAAPPARGGAVLGRLLGLLAAMLALAAIAAVVMTMTGMPF